MNRRTQKKKIKKAIRDQERRNRAEQRALREVEKVFREMKQKGIWPLRYNR